MPSRRTEDRGPGSCVSAKPDPCQVILFPSVIAIGVFLLSDNGRILLGFCFVIAVLLVRLALAGAILIPVLFGTWSVVQTLSTDGRVIIIRTRGRMCVA